MQYHLEYARQLRKHSTLMEAKLWHQLKSRQVSGLKFRRQCPVGPYIVDFVSFEKMLVIEVDGSQHALQREYDEIRTQFLNSLGYKVIRFWNNEVQNQFDAVMEKIFQCCHDVLTPLTPTPLPEGEGLQSLLSLVN